MQVQALLKKLSSLEIKTICPLHGPILKENLEYYIEKYNTWSSYEAEDNGVFIAYASIHGNTADAAREIEEILKKNGAPKALITDLARCDMAEAVEDAFRYEKLVVCASSYDADVFTPMKIFLENLRSKNYQKRKIGIIENGTWAPSAGRCMKEIIGKMKDIEIIEPMVTIKGTLNEDTKEKLKELADVILK